jgi:hypothetical protein
MPVGACAKKGASNIKFEAASLDIALSNSAAAGDELDREYHKSDYQQDVNDVA